MSFVYQAEIKDTRRCEVLVVGGGPAGIAAAIAAARKGAGTLLVDRNGFVGGTATASVVGPFMTCYDGNNERQIILCLLYTSRCV